MRSYRIALAAIAALAALAGAQSAAAADGCASGLTCASVSVPLDWSGQTPGSIDLHVEVLRPAAASKGVMFLVAGGPGQASAGTFDLGDPTWQRIYRLIFPSYTLVAYDDRGTGRSGFLDCPGAFADQDLPHAAATCAAALGTQRDFYTTADHANDLEAVRAFVGANKVGIWGVSYGTKLAIAYARAYPTHVERLLLDSVVDPYNEDPLDGSILREMPKALSSMCAGSACKAATPDFAGDVVRLAEKLNTAPIGKLDGVELLNLVLGSDLNPGLEAELPAAIHSALANRPQLLVHAAALAKIADASFDDISAGLFLATVCGDDTYTWAPGLSVGERARQVDAAIAARPDGAFGPFGDWAAGFGNLKLCLGWPSRVAPPEQALAPALPDVPVLALSGAFDIRTPTANAAAVVARFPHGQLLVVPGVGHSVLTADATGCAIFAVRSWLDAGTPDTKLCKRPAAYVTPIAALPAAPAKKLTAAQTKTLATQTLREAEAAWLTVGSSTRTVTSPGVSGGTLVATANTLTLRNYTLVRGVSLSGKLTVKSWGPPIRFKGTLQVGGSAARHGALKP